MGVISSPRHLVSTALIFLWVSGPEFQVGRRFRPAGVQSHLWLTARVVHGQCAWHLPPKPLPSPQCLRQVLECNAVFLPVCVEQCYHPRLCVSMVSRCPWCPVSIKGVCPEFRVSPQTPHLTMGSQGCSRILETLRVIGGGPPPSLQGFTALRSLDPPTPWLLH